MPISSAAADWVPRAFDGGTVTALCRRGDTLYAGTQGGGIYRSGDEGRGWQPVLKPGTYLEPRLEIVSMAATPSHLIIVTPNAGHRLRIGETIWTALKHPVYPTMPFKARKLVSDGEKVLALGAGTEYFFSVDGGGTWGSRKVSGGSAESLTDIALAGEGILAVTSGQVISSADWGANWKLALAEASARILGSGGGRIWISTPQKLLRADWSGLLSGTAGTSWTALDLAGIPANRRDLTAAAEVQGRLWVAGGNSLYLSRDASGTFQAVTLPAGAEPGRIAAMLPTATGMVAGSALEGIIAGTFENAIGGAAGSTTALPSNAGLYNRTVHALARHKGRLHAAVKDRGLFTSPDSGRSWEGPAAGFRVDAKPAFYFHAFDAFYYGHANGIHRIAEDGKPPVRMGAIPGPSHLVTAERHKDLLFAATAEDGLYISRDSGLTWARPNPDTGWYMTGVTMKGLASTGRTLFAVGGNTNRSQLYRSRNDGGSWESMAAWLYMDNQDTYSLHVMGDTVFAGTTWDLYASGDEGETWKRREVFSYTSSLVERIISDGDFMMAASRNSGAAISRDRGRTWERLTYFSAPLTSGLTLGGNDLFGTDGLSLTAFYPNGAPPESIFRPSRASGKKPGVRLLVSTERTRNGTPREPVYDIRGGRLDRAMVLPPGVFILAPEPFR